MLLRLLPGFFFVKSQPAKEKTIIKNLDKCSETKEIKNNIYPIFLQKYPTHKISLVAGGPGFGAKLNYNYPFN